jgi:hypothetical protein
MSATERKHPTADYVAISLKRLHDKKFWQDAQNEWLPRRARFELQIGPSLGFSRVWREVRIDLESGPEFLYGYFPFLCYVYVNDRAETVLEFDAPQQRRTALIRVPVGMPVTITVVCELASAPSASGHGSDNRELALRFAGIALADGVTDAPQAPVPQPATHADLDLQWRSDAPARPVFVVGSYRSATSVLTWALGQHPNIWPMEESGWLAPLADGALFGYENARTAARGFFDVYDVSRREYLVEIGRSIDQFCRRISQRKLHGILLGRLSGKTEHFNEEFQLSRSLMNPKRRWVDGTPENTHYIMALLLMFPEARFIGLLRDPLDVVISMLRFDRAGGEKRNVRDAAKIWLTMTRMLVLAYQAYGPEKVRMLSHAALVKNPAFVLRDLFDFIGEPDFPTAAGTFTKRINSSSISDEERRKLYAEIDAEPETKKELLELYDYAKRVTEGAWDPDASAERELFAMFNNRIHLVARAYGVHKVTIARDDSL